MGQNIDEERSSELATFGGGCFWCTEAIFERLKGVSEVQSGYSGGHVSNPGYEEVKKGNTGHAEVVQISYNPEIISYSELLKVFFETHDPTSLNRQGADVGTQYRSIILYHNISQRQLAQKAMDQLDKAGIWQDPLVTSLEAFEVFYSAEDYHQEYFENNASQGYCRIVIKPKVEKFEKVFSDLLK